MIHCTDHSTVTVALLGRKNSDPFTIDHIETFSTESILLVAFPAIKAEKRVEQNKPFQKKKLYLPTYPYPCGMCQEGETNNILFLALIRKWTS